MPSSSRRCSEPPLSREQCLLAGKILKTRFDPSKGLTQLTKTCKAELVISVNENFERNGLGRSYTLNKLETWTGNSLYRWRCIQKQHKPQSWRPKGELAATARTPIAVWGAEATVIPESSVAHNAALDSAHGPMKTSAHTIQYRNIRPRTSSTANNFDSGVVHNAALDSALGQMKTSTQRIQYRNIRPRATSTAKNFSAKGATVTPSSAEMVAANRLVALSAVCAASLRTAPPVRPLTQPSTTTLRPVEPWNSVKPATAYIIKEEPFRRPQRNDCIRAL